MTLSSEESRPDRRESGVGPRRYGTDDLRQAVQDALRVGVEAGTGLERRDRWLWAFVGVMVAAIILLALALDNQGDDIKVLRLQIEDARKTIAILEDRGERDAEWTRRMRPMLSEGDSGSRVSGGVGGEPRPSERGQEDAQEGPDRQ